MASKMELHKEIVLLFHCRIRNTSKGEIYFVNPENDSFILINNPITIYILIKIQQILFNGIPGTKSTFLYGRIQSL